MRGADRRCGLATGGERAGDQRMACLFDLDGTLVDTDAANRAAYAEAVAAHGGGPIDDATWATCAGRSWRAFLPRLLPLADAATLAAAHQAKQVAYRRHLHRVRIHRPLVALVLALRGRVPVALVTTASRTAVTGVLAHAGLADAFDAVVTGDDVAQGKPDPAGYLRGLELLRVASGTALAYEDSDVGAAAASAAGIAVLRIAPW